MAVRVDAGQVPAPRRDEYTAIVLRAIDSSRPAGEDWVVMLFEPFNGTALRIDFSRGTEAHRSMTFAPEEDDAVHSGLFRAACKFLREHWPGGIRPN